MTIVPEQHKFHFKNHRAHFQDLGNIKILDYAAPNTFEYRIRFLFEEDFYRLHISGDLGELIACNYCNMCFEKFSDFLKDPYYFESKVDCCSRPLYACNKELAEKELREILDTAKDGGYLCVSDYCDDIDEIISGLMEELDDYTISSAGHDTLMALTDNIADIQYTYTFGKERTGILELYLYAFDLAMQDLKKQRKEMAV